MRYVFPVALLVKQLFENACGQIRFVGSGANNFLPFQNEKKKQGTNRME